MIVPESGGLCSRCYEANRDIRLALSGAESFAESARILLTALTQHRAFAYDRAALFMRVRNSLSGYAAVGIHAPEDVATFEAARESDFAKVLSELPAEVPHRSEFEKEVRALTIPLSEKEDQLVGALLSGLPQHISGGLGALRGESAAGAGVAFPLFARGHAYAVVYADRPFCGTDPTEVEMWRASALGNMVDDFGESEQLWIPAVSEPVGVLAERMLTVTRLAMRLAHLARNPLAVVGGFSYHLINRVGDSGPARKALEAIVQSTTRLEELIDDIPAYALSPDSEPGELDLRDVVEDGIRSLPRGCRWTMDLPEEPVIVVTYPGIVAACVYIVGRYLGMRGIVKMNLSADGQGNEIWFCSEEFEKMQGMELMSVNQLVRMIGGSSHMEAERGERRLVITIPHFVHCPLAGVERVEQA